MFGGAISEAVTQAICTLARIEGMSNVRRLNERIRIEAMDIIPPFSSQQIEAVARVLADTTEGLTGSEIGFILGDAGIPDIDPSNTKWKRLYNALASIQNEKGFAVGHQAITPERTAVGHSQSRP